MRTFTFALAWTLVSAWRGLRGARWTSLVAVMALGLGVGASLTAAAVAYAGLIRPLPFPNPDDLATVGRTYLPTSMQGGVKLSEFDDWRDRLAGVATLCGYSSEPVTVRGTRSPEETSIAYVAGSFFDVLGAAAEAGRPFTEADPYDTTVVSHRFAVRLAGSPAAALDRAITAGSRTLRIVAVMPSSFAVLDDRTDLWTPARGVGGVQLLGQSDARSYTLIARAGAGHSLADVRTRAAEALKAMVPANQRDSWRLDLQPLHDTLLGSARPLLLVFLASSLLVLLMACANVATVLVNRAVSRRREFALRLALGSSRGQLIATTIAEVTMLAMAGSALGWWIALIATSAMSALDQIDRQAALGVPMLAMVTMTAPLMWGAAAAAVLVVVACGAAPIAAMRPDHLALSLRVAATTSSRTGRRIRAALVVAQLTMTVVLLVGAGLLGRTLLWLGRVDLGLNATSRVFTMQVPIGESLTATSAPARLQMVDQILESVRRLPGVASAGVGSNLPPSARSIAFTIRYVSDGRDATRTFDLASATDGYLDAIGARLVSGRLFTAADMTGEAAVAVLSESAMRHLGLKPGDVDHDLNMALPSAGGPRVKPRIIGVIRDVRFTGLEAPANGGIYVRWRQMPMGRGFLVVRTTGDPAAMRPAILRAVRAVDPTIPLRPRSLEEEVDRDLAPRAARFDLVAVYAIGAVLLAVVGLAGALIRSVVERQRELAIRAAIGATPSRLMRAVLVHGLGLAVLGTVLGVAAALAAARAAASVIFGVTPYDPLTYGVTVAGVLTVAFAASYLPARRAAAADPITLLRSE